MLAALLAQAAPDANPTDAEPTPPADTPAPPEPAQGDAPPAEGAPVEDQLGDAMNQAQDDVTDAAQGILEGDFTATMDLVNQYVLPAVSVLLILIIGLFVGKFLGRVIGNTVAKRVDPTLGKFLQKLVFYVVFILFLIGILGYFDFSVTSFAAILAAAGFAVGLAFQGTLSNFASGVMLLTFRPFKVGDFIAIGGESGTVHEIELFTVALDTLDNRRIILPNSAIFGSTIENITHHPERRVDVNVGVEYGADMDKTREVLAAACESLRDKLIDGDGRGYQVYLLELGDSSVNWVCRFWTKAEDYWDVREQLTRAVKNHLDEAGLGIPFPQMDVHLDGKLSGK